ncbi:TIGR02301 family protein [Methylocystis heyeri]|uniref:TIGR02301 family protein n=2 Tax=Methylocystis heyeri TaxID=391905 RepID=A0A6B8KL78_9HYPH|nr:TIGR02301 family protein [Methylocystis heyeri]
MSGRARRLRLLCSLAIVAGLVPSSPDALAATPARAKTHGASPQKGHKAAKPAPKPEQKAPEPAAQTEPPPAPYDPQLVRLSEVLGGLSFLRDLCGDGDGEDFRSKMSQLRDSAAPAGVRRQKLTAAFNRGFRGYELTYRSCTPNARLVIARYLEEAERLSQDVVTRYGNP